MNGPPGGTGEPPSDYMLEHPEEPDQYCNFIPYNAPTYLRNLIDRFERLDAIPCGLYPSYGYYEKDRTPEVVSSKAALSRKQVQYSCLRLPQQEEIKEVLESCGWPDQFRREDWKKNMEEHWENAI